MKKFLIITVFVLIIVGVFILFQKTTNPSVSPTPNNPSWSGIVPGQTSTKDATKILGTPIASNGNILDFQSKSPTRNNKVTSENGKVVFIRQIIAKGDNTSTTQITDKYGLAPVHLYGPDSEAGIDLYVYPDIGIAYLANQPKEYLSEIWYFEPMKVENFITKWAPNYSLDPQKNASF